MEGIATDFVTTLIEYSVIFGILALAIYGFLSGNLVAGWMYREQLEENRVLRDQLKTTVELATKATDQAEKVTTLAERQLHAAEQKIEEYERLLLSKGRQQR
jgi:CHASE1-domain containing sensor protein